MRSPKTSAKAAEMRRAETHAAEVHPSAPEMHAAAAKAPKATGYGWACRGCRYANRQDRKTTEKLAVHG
ncbi:hypothetical protein [Methylocystis sp. MJC1]|uniref:hypothetical protein n=1 Tax=Methylocystis sp. MJC1 TaxID=2654282 RepID=UPI0027D222EB|nr:hypothetical protein [Methylocystis sp. MJC1]